MPLNKVKKNQFNTLLDPSYGSRYLQESPPKYRLPETEMPPRAAYDLIHDQLMLDGNSRLNLATFVTTWMEPEARQLMADTFDKNMIDKDEYPQTAEIEERCIHILADMWHCPTAEEAVGCSTTGSSEAGMLAGMAMKWRWRERMKALNKPHDKPNLVMGVNVQVCWEKFCRYWDIEMRQVPMEEGRYIISPELAMELCDENTIGIIGILGSTFTGEYEPIAELNAAVEQLNQQTGWEIPIHVDAASGGFIAPFIQEKLHWDFRLKWVKSINASGHKYGLVYPGVGWVVWRDKADLPDNLIFNVNYLGGQMPTFALNFSRPGNQIIAQYYNFLRLDREGYTRIQQNCQDIATYLAKRISEVGPFELLSDGSDLPVFAWKMNQSLNYNLYDLADRLRYNGWLIPAYSLPDNLSDTIVMRIVVKEGFSRELADLLLVDIKRALSHFEQQAHINGSEADEESRGGFHH